jgi:hypothetical protein
LGPVFTLHSRPQPGAAAATPAVMARGGGRAWKQSRSAALDVAEHGGAVEEELGQCLRKKQGGGGRGRVRVQRGCDRGAVVA